MRGGAVGLAPFRTLAVCQEPRYLCFLLLASLVILKSHLLSYYLRGARTSVILKGWTVSIHRSLDNISEQCLAFGISLNQLFHDSKGILVNP